MRVFFSWEFSLSDFTNLENFSFRRNEMCVIKKIYNDRASRRNAMYKINIHNQFTFYHFLILLIILWMRISFNLKIF